MALKEVCLPDSIITLACGTIIANKKIAIFLKKVLWAAPVKKHETMLQKYNIGGIIYVF
jgi:hypothetical protein